MANVTANIQRLFGNEAPAYFEMVEPVLKRAKAHEYRFFSSEFVNELLARTPPPMAEIHAILAHELIEKAHLCAVSAMLRNKSWIEVCIREFSAGSYFGFAAGARGYIESVADSMDGLLVISATLAENHVIVQTALSGRMSGPDTFFSDIEAKLDHYMLAGWSREKNSVLKAKENQTYIEGLVSAAMPNLLIDWRRLCTITHPSASSVNAHYEFIQSVGKTIFPDGLEERRCDELLGQIKPSLSGLLSYTMNPSLLILRVLHKFGKHPLLPEMKTWNWDKIPAWERISNALRSYQPDQQRTASIH